MKKNRFSPLITPRWSLALAAGACRPKVKEYFGTIFHQIAAELIEAPRERLFFHGFLNSPWRAFEVSVEKERERSAPDEYYVGSIRENNTGNFQGARKFITCGSGVFMTRDH